MDGKSLLNRWKTRESAPTGPTGTAGTDQNAVAPAQAVTAPVVNANEGSFYVVGVTFEGRQEVLGMMLERFTAKGTQFPAKLVLEDDNKFDQYAVKVQAELEGYGFLDIGYVPRDINQDLRALIPKINEVRIISVGRQAGKKAIGAKLYYRVG